jgi:hypothetical protein
MNKTPNEASVKTNAAIVQKALAVRTEAEAKDLCALIERAVGHRYTRPVGDKGNNVGILTASGSSYDHKILELVTNMQDAVLERLAVKKYGDRKLVRFKTPREAAENLLGDLDHRKQAELITVELASSGEGKKRITVVARDQGCGMTSAQVPETIFQVGAWQKDGFDWLQGNFGMGGATTLRNAKAAVLVTRRDPELLSADEADVITVAVVRWERVKTTESAFYLVTSPWKKAGDDALPFSIPADDFPEFEVGTHFALVSYGTEGLARKSGDERSFDTVFNTRLFNTVTPIRYRNLLVRDRNEYLRGLKKRLEDNPGEIEGTETLPFSVKGVTYHLPIRFRIFAKPGEPGAVRNFVAKGHALVVTSNGQVHYHWAPQEFKLRTKHKKLYNRILVIVESDALPIEDRTQLFTADRSQLVRTDTAIKLEEEISAFLNEWAELIDQNNALIREAISGDSTGRPTIDIARKIARSLNVKGFSMGGPGGSGGGKRPPKPSNPEDLYDDPTHFEGPESAEAVIGKVKGVYFKLNAKDGFIGKRAELIVICDHPDIGDEELTVGELRSGRVRVAVSVPDHVDPGICSLQVMVGDWTKSSGGIGANFDWTTKLEFLAEARARQAGTGGGKKPGTSGPNRGNLVAVLWKNHDDENHPDEWEANTVGDVEMIAGKELAAERDEYKELAGIDDEIPTVILNRSYSPLKQYIHARAQDLTDEGKEAAVDRYAVGVGVGLIMLDKMERDAEKKEQMTNADLLREAQRSVAKSVLSVLPDYDKLAREIDEG